MLYKVLINELSKLLARIECIHLKPKTSTHHTRKVHKTIQMIIGKGPNKVVLQWVVRSKKNDTE